MLTNGATTTNTDWTVHWIDNTTLPQIDWDTNPTIRNTLASTTWNYSVERIEQSYAPKTIHVKLPQGNFTLKLNPTEYNVEFDTDMSLILRIASDGISVTEDFVEYEADMSIEDFLGICKEGQEDNC